MVGKAYNRLCKGIGDRIGGHLVTLHQDKKNEKERLQSIQPPGLHWLTL